ncbi:hypothetical protein DO021_20040 [Desulfobacter hydrogenophilus]|uniref:Uncharacterized protein n=1 Tax=Desulfobacter hydrogenophilus TaxID=2291 RepID=A0A328F6W2_9BACT|nr:hypothetical protein [Desulfobacter hydrogenophilus]NDY74136.1 hypothetical protein [Desulfobacter hydrogenophilus]QBH15194.1 hypothetical protein EYB58_21090 [Desulfobacter hydrogenophilus]RAM00258.1 hypothetical protein DO021_20040 [Desulfobacter hydrogenophilus]
MIQAIFRKEFFKIRVLTLLTLIVHICILLYIYVSTRRLFILDHPEVVWYRVLHLGQIYYGTLKYIPLLSGILIACFQFLPEMWGERFRLSLHLPVSPALVALSHLLVGMTVYCALALIDLWGLGLIMGLFFPWQGIKISLLTALPWAMAGAAAYLGMALAMLEPDFRLKAVNLIITAGVTGLYLQNVDPGAYGPSLVLLIVPLILLMPAVLLPVFRFRYRRVG